MMTSATYRPRYFHYTGLLRWPLWGAPILLTSCAPAGVLDPQGPIASAEHLILINSTAIMLVVVVPVILATLAFAWWYRASNDRASRASDKSYEGRIEFVVWSIPALTVILLGGVIWIGSHQLDPRAPIAAKNNPVRVEVVSLDWKWLFIYPDLGIASVNHLVVPVGTPISFELTSAGVMNSFFVPQLGSQIYAMAGMTSQLSLQADESGDYPGISAQFSGGGFSDMRFIVHAMSADDYARWLASAKDRGAVLDTATYAALAQQSSDVKPATYHGVDPKLFDSIVDETAPPSGGAQEQPGGQSSSAAGGRG
jgi:cytochrome o ubiquinol oxidase subunit 2